jgi:hypothetical protein
MKREGLDHPKIVVLARELHIPIPHAVGLLEYLWAWAYKYAPQGDVGRYPDRTIAEGSRWVGVPQRYLMAMVRAGWLDVVPDPAIRYAIHDIEEHADNAWKQRLANKGLTWWNGADPRSGKAGRPDKTISKQSPNNIHLSEPEPEPEPENRRAAARKARLNGSLSEQQTGWFSEFWKLYPRHVARAVAEKAFGKAAQTEEQFNAIMHGLNRQIGKLMASDPDYRPHPATWLNARRWEDEAPTEKLAPPSPYTYANEARERGIL